MSNSEVTGSQDQTTSTELSFYNSPHYNTDLDTTQSCCGSQKILLWNFTMEL